MSQLNHNQGNNTGGGRDYHPRRNVPHRPGQQAFVYPAQGYIPTEYGGYAQSVYSAAAPQGYYPPNGGQYYNQYSAAPPAAFQGIEHHHPINLTTQTGEKVDIKGLPTTPKTTHLPINITPKTPHAAINTHQRTPSVTPVTPADPNTLTKKEAFKAAILAKAKAKAADAAAAAQAGSKAESEAPKKENIEPSTAPSTSTSTTSTSSSTSTPTPTTTTTTTTTTTSTQKEAQPQKTSTEDLLKKEKVVENKVEITKPEVKEAKVEVQPEIKKDESKEVSKEQEPVTKEKVEEEPSKKEVETPVQVKSDESQPVKATETSEPSVEASSTKEDKESSELTLSKFFTKLSEAKTIKDPFSFQYPSGFQAPSPKLKENSKVALRYDPPFLLQFAPKSKLPADDEFKKSISFILDNLADKGRGNGGGGGYRGGFGQGSIQGIQGFVKSQTNLKKFGNMDSRSNSRQGSKRKGGSGRGVGDRRSNRNRGEREPEKEKEPAEPAEPVKPLEKSASRWVPRSKVKKETEIKYAPDGVTVLLTEDEVSAKSRSYLNKLTLEHFDSITDDILSIANQSKYEENAETLKLVVRAIFDKATDEPHWAGMYAQLCAKLCKSIDPEVCSNELDCGGGKLARLLLLSTCQQEYERGWTVNLPTNEDGSAIEPEMMTDEYYKVAAAKRRGLGLVRFIGHLFVLQLLSSKVVNACISKLTENVENPTDDVVENLVQLLRTTGPKIDSDEGGKGLLNKVFEKITYMSERADLNSRLKFSLLDLMDLRAARWKSDEADKGPKTLAEIREAENKKKEEERAKSAQQKRGVESRSNSQRGVWGNRNLSISDMKKVGKFSTPRSSSSDLGPLNNFTSKSKSGRKSMTPSGRAPMTSSPSVTHFENIGTRENSRRNVSSNSFHLLGDHNDDDDDDDDENDEKKDKDDK